MIAARRRTAPAGIALAPLLIAAILLVSAASGWVRVLDVGVVSILGAFSAVAVALALLFWLGSPVVPRAAIVPLGLLLLFLLWIGTEALIIPPNLLGVQNAVVMVGFFGLILLTSREALRSQRFVGKILPKLFRIALWISLISYLLQVPRYGFDSHELVSARGFADFALMGLAWAVSEAKTGKRSARVLTAATILLIFVSLSRLASAIIIVMLAVAQLDWSSRKSKIRFFAGMTIGVTIFLYSINSIAPIRDRFFSGDVSLRVGGILINGEGRRAMWAVTLASARTSLLFGKGGGSSSTLIHQLNGLDHPHNDYLRILHDYGLIGLSLWVLALVVITWILFKRWRAATKIPGHRWGHVHQAAFLAMLAFVILMIADNPVAYPFVMLPLGILVGCALGTPIRQSRE